MLQAFAQSFCFQPRFAFCGETNQVEEHLPSRFMQCFLCLCLLLTHWKLQCRAVHDRLRGRDRILLLQSILCAHFWGWLCTVLLWIAPLAAGCRSGTEHVDWQLFEPAGYGSPGVLHCRVWQENRTGQKAPGWDTGRDQCWSVCQGMVLSFSLGSESLCKSTDVLLLLDSGGYAQ